MKILRWSLLIFVALLMMSYSLIYRGNNRYAVFLHHGIKLPDSAREIKFSTYPGLLAHLMGLDDGSNTHFVIAKNDYRDMLKDEYFNKNNRGWSCADCESFAKFNDSIADLPLPSKVYFKSRRGDYLMVSTGEYNDSELVIHLYTDWN